MSIYIYEEIIFMKIYNMEKNIKYIQQKEKFEILLTSHLQWVGFFH